MGTHPIFESNFDCLTVFIMPPKKQFGLIKRKKPESTLVKSKLSFFDDDGDNDGEEHTVQAEKKRIEAELKTVAAKKKMNKQTQLDVQRALEQDASIYDYDGVYDEMKQIKQETSEEKKVAARKPKYMATLLETAKKRQQLHERRTERKVQKEREQEGDEFADKESFVTEAYKQKMVEIKQQEEAEKLQDLKESVMDVTKQRDMSGFYKHLLNRTSRTTEPAAVEESKTPQKSEGEKQAEEIEEAKDARAQFVRKDIHLAKRFRTRRTGEEEDEVSSDEEVGAEEAHVKQETIKTEQSEINPDADEELPSSDDEGEANVKQEGDVKQEKDVKTDPDQPKKLESGQLENETLAEFKERLKKKKERRLDVYRRRNKDEDIDAARKRFHERRNERKMAGRPV